MMRLALAGQAIDLKADTLGALSVNMYHGVGIT